MPLFCTLATKYAGTATPAASKFESRGYPLMFETQNKHMFFVDSGDTKSTKTVHKFYGAPLSVIHGATCYDGITTTYNTNMTDNMRWGYFSHYSTTNVPNNYVHYNLNFGEKINVISSLGVNDHEITAKYIGVTLPSETQLSYNNTINITTKSLTHGGTFSTYSITSVSNHTINQTQYNLILPTETTLSLERSTSSITPKHGESFDVVSSLSVSNHTITPTYTTVTLPETYLYATEYLSPPIFRFCNGAIIHTKNEDKTLTLFNGNNIIMSVGTEYNNSTAISIGGRIGNSITISAINTHSVDHTFSTTATSGIGIITLNNANSGGTTGTSFTVTGGDGITITGSGTNLTITNSKPDVNHNTDTKLTTVSTNNTTYLIGKSVKPTTSTDNSMGYGNPYVYMNSGNIYAKHFYATNPNLASWGANVDAALEITGTGSNSQIPIFRVKSTTHNCQLELQESTGKLRLYNDSNYAEFPDRGITGKIPISTAHDSNNTTLVKDIRVVSALPSNASSYPNTLFLVTGGGN